MKILFLRHGEAVDDIENRYGGWADYELTYKGKEQVLKKIPLIQTLNIPFEKVFSSTLKRAFEVGTIVSKELDIELEGFPYLKEYNGYGILSGLTKEEALEKYPDQVAKLPERGSVDSSELVESFHGRVKRVFEEFESSHLDAIIAVSHGGMIREICALYLNKPINKTSIEDCGFMLCDYDEGTLTLIYADGILFEE